MKRTKRTFEVWARSLLGCLLLTAACGGKPLDKGASDPTSPQLEGLPLPDPSPVLSKGFDPFEAYGVKPASGHGHHGHHDHHGADVVDDSLPADVGDSPAVPAPPAKPAQERDPEPATPKEHVH